MAARAPKIVLTTLCLILLTMGVGRLSAAPHAEGKVRKAVETWIRHATADNRPSAKIERLEPYQANGITAAYIVHLEGGGYCLAGADSLVLPVYWYCPKGTYDAKNPGTQAILKEIAGRLSFVQGDLAKGGAVLKPHQKALAQRAQAWDDLSAGNVPSSLATEAVTANASSASMIVLPLTSLWNQGAPYNDACPALPAGSANHTVVGCVATATAQVMYYWRWPNTGSGTVSGTYQYRSTAGTVSRALTMDPKIPTYWGPLLRWSSGTLSMVGAWDASILKTAYSITNDASYHSALQNLYDSLDQNQSSLFADLGNTTYRWDLLKDVHAVPVDAGDTEVAKLCSHVGLSVGMDYGHDGSGASRYAIPGGLSGHFRYDSDAHSDGRDVNLMVEEIRWGRPLILCGDSSSDSHCWVVYGYNQGTSPWQFAMNMGWGGSLNGWYSVDTVPFGLTDNQTEVTMVAPYDAVRFVGATSSGDGSPSSPHKNVEEGLNNAPNGATLIFKANSINTFSAPSLVLNRPLTLKGYQATITK